MPRWMQGNPEHRTAGQRTKYIMKAKNNYCMDMCVYTECVYTSVQEDMKLLALGDPTIQISVNVSYELMVNANGIS